MLAAAMPAAAEPTPSTTSVDGEADVPCDGRAPVLLLAVVADGGAPPAVTLQAVFDERGGTLGRAADATLVLPDPARTISRRHARIVFRLGRWFIGPEGNASLSVNGRVVGAGEEVALAAGDIVRIGGFVIEVRAASPAEAADHPFADLPPSAPDSLDTLFGLDHGPVAPDSPLSAPPASAPRRFPDADPFACDDDERTFMSLRRAPAPQAPSLEPGDDIRLGAAAPAACERGRWFVAHFAAYPPAQEAAVSSLLQSQSPEARQVLGKRGCRWAPGTDVQVTLRADGFEVPHPSQRFAWNSRIETLDFPLRATEAAAQASVLEFAVAIAGITVAVIGLNVRVGHEAAGATVQSSTAPARTAFASYASADRPLVVHMAGVIERSAGVDVFLDCLDLHASESWKPRLAREIAARDRFLLFWSRRARASRWVEWEWQVALRDKGERALQMHPLEPDVPPPAGLEHLHAGSVHALVAAYYAQQPWWRRAWRAVRWPAPGGAARR